MGGAMGLAGREPALDSSVVADLMAAGLSLDEIHSQLGIVSALSAVPAPAEVPVGGAKGEGRARGGKAERGRGVGTSRGAEQRRR